MFCMTNLYEKMLQGRDMDLCPGEKGSIQEGALKMFFCLPMPRVFSGMGRQVLQAPTPMRKMPAIPAPKSRMRW